MNFNSLLFLFLFLPITLLGFYLINRKGPYKWSFIWLVGASIIFYGFWNLVLTGVLFGSVLTNYVLARFINSSQGNKVNSKKILYFGIICNLGVLIFFKNFGNPIGHVFDCQFAIIYLAMFNTPILRPKHF